MFLNSTRARAGTRCNEDSLPPLAHLVVQVKHLGKELWGTKASMTAE
jgi:hypothetical protein